MVIIVVGLVWDVLEPMLLGRPVGFGVLRSDLFACACFEIAIFVAVACDEGQAAQG